MDALILASSSPSASADLARPIAGAPMLIRQLELLRANGIERAVVNRVASEPLAAILRAEALASTGVKVTWIPSDAPLSPIALAQRAGLSDTCVLILPHGWVGAVDVRGAIADAATQEPTCVRVTGGSLALRSVIDERPARTVDVSGWLQRVDSETAAQSLTEDLLAGRRGGIEVRGSELSPGLWTSRGAVVEPGAVVEAPCYLGPGCFVADGAHLGPGTVLGEGAVVERGAFVAHARIQAGLVVGQGVTIEHGLLSEAGLESHDGETVPIDDELLLGRRRSRHLLSRAAAAAAYVILVPGAVAMGGAMATAVRRLARVVDGTGEWVGVRDGGADAVVLDVQTLLVPPDAQDAERAAARSLYRAKKSLALDAKLLLGVLVGAGR